VRWDRLFEELEASSHEVRADEREALAADLQDEQWAALSWIDLLGAADVRLDVSGLGEVGGVESVGDVIVLRDGLGRRTVVVPEAVVAVNGADGRAAPPPTSRRTRRQLVRALRDAELEVRVVRRDGSAVEGRIVAAGADFVQLGVGGRRVSLPWSSIAALVER